MLLNILVAMALQAVPDAAAQDTVRKGGMTFICYEEMARFPGDVQEYLHRNMRYPEKAAAEGIEGRAVVKTTINAEGLLTETQIGRSAGDSSLDAEALRLARAMPRWKPARVKGVAVACPVFIPVVFQLE